MTANLFASTRKRTRVTRPRVCIIALNYNGLQHLQYCLPSLLTTDYPNYELVVVDNASTDGSVKYVQREFPQATLLRSPTNRGWSGGNNLGIRYALKSGAAYVALANSDIKVDPRWIRIAVALCEADPLVGMVGYHILAADEDLDQAVNAWHQLRVTSVTGIQGCALFIRSDVFRQVGLIDETFFAYGEEVDLEYRAIHAGYKLIDTNVPVWHYGEGFWQHYPLRAGVMAMQGQIHFAIKHMSLLAAIHNILSVARLACSLFPPQRPMSPPIRRLRPSNILVNCWLFLRALAWNAWHLPRTLRQRVIDRRLAESVARERFRKSPDE